MAWRTARSLLQLHVQLKGGSRAAPPATDPTEWGTIGDAVHDPTSDHAPHDFAGWGSQIVTAADFPDRPDLGLDARRVLDDLRRSHDARVKYGISHGQMFSSYATSGYPAWTWRPYDGADGHFTHGHLSVVGDPRADGVQPWATIGAIMEIDAAQMEIISNTHDRVQAMITGLPYGVKAPAVPQAVKLQGVLAQAQANGSALSSLASVVATLRTEVAALRAAVDAPPVLEVDAAALAAALLANEEFAAVLAAAAFAGSQRAETE